MLYLEVAGGENARAALDYTKHYRSPRMIGMDADYGMMRSFQSMGWPRFVIIDPKGVVRFHGFDTDPNLSNLRKCLGKLIATGEGSPAFPQVVQDGVLYPRFVCDARKASRERSPRLAIDPNGKPWVVYYSNRDGDNEVVLRRPGPEGRFTEEALTDNEADDYAPDAAFDSSGVLWVAWCSNRDGMYDVYVRAIRPDGKGDPVRLSRSTDDAMRPRIAAGPDGRLTVTYYKWRRMRVRRRSSNVIGSLIGRFDMISRDRDIFARRYDPKTGEWGKETEISPHLPEVEDHTDPDVVVDGRGDSWVVWSYDYHPQLFSKPHDTDQPSVFAAKWGTNGGVSLPILAGTVGRRLTAIDLFPSVAIDAGGALWCAWDARDGNGPGRRVRIARLSGERFDKAVDVSARTAVCSTPEISAGADGALIATWSQRSGDVWQGKVAILRDGKVAAEATVDTAGSDVLFPHAMQTPDGQIWLVYERSDEKGAEIIVEDLTKRLEDRNT